MMSAWDRYIKPCCRFIRRNPIADSSKRCDRPITMRCFVGIPPDNCAVYWSKGALQAEGMLDLAQFGTIEICSASFSAEAYDGPFQGFNHLLSDR